MPTTDALGANGVLVEELLARCSEPAGDVSIARRALIAASTHIPGPEATPGARVRGRMERIIADARDLDWTVVVAVDGALNKRFAADLAVNVPDGTPRQQAHRLLLAALLWPAVHGANPNPLAAALDMARAGSFAEFGERRLHQWRSGIEVPVDLPTDVPSAGIITALH